MIVDLLVRTAIAAAIIAMMLVIVGMAWGGTYVVGAVLMIIALVLFGAAGAVAAIRPGVNIGR